MSCRDARGGSKPGLLAGFGVQFVESFFEAVLLLKGSGGFLNAVLVVDYHFLYALDLFRVLEPLFDLVKTFG